MEDKDCGILDYGLLDASQEDLDTLFEVIEEAFAIAIDDLAEAADEESMFMFMLGSIIQVKVMSALFGEDGLSDQLGRMKRELEQEKTEKDPGGMN